MKKNYLFLFLFSVIISNSLFAYVAKIEQTGQTFTSIQAALNSAIDGNTVLIAPGTHYVSGLTFWTEDIIIKAEAEDIYGNIDYSDKPILDGSGVYRIMSNFSQGSVEIRNLIFSNGGTSTVASILCTGGSTSFYKCDFEYCDGTAVQSYDQSEISFNFCSFYSNAGSSSLDVSNSKVLNIRETEFVSNSNRYSVLKCSSVEDIYVKYSLFFENVSSTYVIITNKCKNIRTAETIFNGNKVLHVLRNINRDGNDGIPYEIVNCEFSRNTLYRSVLDLDSRDLSLIHSTFGLNTFPRPMVSRAGHIFCTNTILWDEGLDSQLRGKTISISYSDVKGGVDGLISTVVNYGDGMLNEDPLFPEDELFLEPSQFSPVIDAGSPVLYTNIDIVGTSRILNVNLGLYPDMGAYEFSKSKLKSEFISSKKIVSEDEVYFSPIVTKDDVFVYNLKGNEVIEIYSMSGLKLEEFYVEYSPFQINLSDMNTGIYQVLVKSDISSATQLIVVE